MSSCEPFNFIDRHRIFFCSRSFVLLFSIVASHSCTFFCYAALLMFCSIKLLSSFILVTSQCHCEARVIPSLKLIYEEHLQPITNVFLPLGPGLAPAAWRSLLRQDSTRFFQKLLCSLSNVISAAADRHRTG